MVKEKAQHPSPVQQEQGHLRRQQKREKKGDIKIADTDAPPGLSGTNSDQDPWIKHDPWKGWKQTAPVPMEDDHPSRSMVASLEERVATNVQKNNEERFQKLEVDIAEVKMQHHKHEQWFQDAGVANQRLQSQVSNLTNQVTQQQQEVSSLSMDIMTGFQNIEALLAKKQRMD